MKILEFIWFWNTVEADLSISPKQKKGNTASCYSLNASDTIDSFLWLWITVNFA